MRISLWVCVLAAGTLAASPAWAIDCSKAQTPVENAICGSPQLQAADDQMAAAYKALRNSLNPHHRQGLLTSQRLWLLRRDRNCNYHGDQLTACIARYTKERTALLRMRPQSGPGVGAGFIPAIFAQTGSKARYEIDVFLPKAANPNSRALHDFNKRIAALLNDTPANEKIDFDPPGQLTFSLTGAITHASPRLISVKLDHWQYTGGAHGFGATTAINVDPKSGMLTFAGNFLSTAADQLSEACRSQILAEKSRRFDDLTITEEDVAQYDAAITHNISDLQFWVFHAGHVKVHFAPYDVGSYAEGAFECRFSYQELRPLMSRTDFLPG